ncbi:MAG: LysR substrate-binding domain-containing protein [Chthoniobacterales bacterium]
MVALMDARHLRLLEVAGDPEEIAIDHRELRLPDGRVPIHSLNIVQEIPSPEAIKRLVAAGLGISYVFRLGVEQELASGKLMKIHCPKLNTRQPFSIYFRRDRPVRYRARLRPVAAGKGQNET